MMRKQAKGIPVKVGQIRVGQKVKVKNSHRKVGWGEVASYNKNFVFVKYEKETQSKAVCYKDLITI